MITPLIKLVDKSSFITFPSALEDFNITGFSNNNNKVYFSHFALLNIPDITTSVEENNSVNFNGIESYFGGRNNIGTGAISDRLDFSESLQNYVMNFESLLTEQEWYDKNKLQTTSERIFFKWLKEIGAMRYEVADSTKNISSEERYIEERSNNYNKVVQYISKIGIQQKITGKKNSFFELYVYMPSDNGSTPNVLFKTLSDENYFNNMVVISESEYINGYGEGELPTSGLDYVAHYDKDTDGVVYITKDQFNNAKNHWFEGRGWNNTYMTDVSFDNPENLIIEKEIQGKRYTQIRSSLDGVMIDFDINNYAEKETSNVETLEELNKQLSSTEFEYNAMLIYYTVENSITGEKATNLYGVPFLGNIEKYSSGSSSITRTIKNKLEPLLGRSGNGMGWRFNFKLDARQDSSIPVVEFDHEEFGTYSMQQFSDAMVRMSEITKRYEKTIELNDYLYEKNNELMAILGTLKLHELKEFKQDIYKKINEMELSDVNNELLGKIQKQIIDIINGQTEVEVKMVTSLVDKDGIKVNYDVDEKVIVVENSRNDFFKLELKYLDNVSIDMNKSGQTTRILLDCEDISMDYSIEINKNKWNLGDVLELDIVNTENLDEDFIVTFLDGMDILSQIDLKNSSKRIVVSSVNPYKFITL